MAKKKTRKDTRAVTRSIALQSPERRRRIPEAIMDVAQPSSPFESNSLSSQEQPVIRGLQSHEGCVIIRVGAEWWLRELLLQREFQLSDEEEDIVFMTFQYDH